MSAAMLAVAGAPPKRVKPENERISFSGDVPFLQLPDQGFDMVRFFGTDMFRRIYDNAGNLLTAEVPSHGGSRTVYGATEPSKPTGEPDYAGVGLRKVSFTVAGMTFDNTFAARERGEQRDHT